MYEFYYYFTSLIFYLAWFCVFLFCYYISKLQFKWCIPICVECLKVIYALSLLLLVRLYYMFRVENMEINWEQIVTDSQILFQNLTKWEL